MRGSLRQRGPNSWRLTLEFGYQRDPVTGALKRVQKYVTVRGTRRDAQNRLNDLLHDVQHDTFIQPDKRTVGQWLETWVDLAIKPPQRTPRAYDTYQSVIAVHLKPALGHIRLQGLRALDIEAFLASKRLTLAPATLEKIYTVLSSALKAAVRSRLVMKNVASEVTNRPRTPEDAGRAISNCWTAEQAAAFLVVALAAGPQPAAFFAVALDSGMRKSELAGLAWSHVDWAQGRLLVQRQLLKGGRDPVFVPTKGKRARTIDLAPETVELLKAHRAAQAAVKMRYRQRYHEHGLVFAKPWAESTPAGASIGLPCKSTIWGSANLRPSSLPPRCRRFHCMA